jgi:carboxypeptidase Taq
VAKNPVVREILEKYTQVWALQHSQAVLGWDTEIGMPEAGARPRGIAQGQVAVMRQKAMISLDGLVTKGEKARDLDDEEKGVVRMMRLGLDYDLKVPPKLVDEIQRVTTEATVVWRTARKKSEFALFRPYLGKIIELERQVADKLGYKGHPYNALLNQFEEGFTVRDADSVYSKLIPGTKKILENVTEAGIYPSKHPLESVKYQRAAMERVNQGVVELLKMPDDRFKMNVSAHPFTTGIAHDDVRITTRYEGVDFKETLFSVIHECGHAIYHLQIDEKFAYGPLDDGPSFGIHESQSRFWENAVGRSREFVRLLAPLMRKNLPFLSRYDDEDLYYYFNTVRRGLIRVDADELTYNFHTAVRYEVEKKAINGDVKVSELPSLWNDTFEEYLGIRPKNDSDGLLQDIHWSDASFGYFPTYTLGNIVTAMIWHKLKDGARIREAVEDRDLMWLRKWLRSNIHRYGATYSPKALQMKVFGETYNPARLLDYLNAKFVV